MTPGNIMPPMPVLSATTPTDVFATRPENAAQDQRVAAEFESVLLSMLVSTMRKSSLGEGLFPGDKSDTFGGLFDMMVAGQMSESGGIGVRTMVSEWLEQQQQQQQQGAAGGEQSDN